MQRAVCLWAGWVRGRGQWSVYLFLNSSLIEKIATRITSEATAHSVLDMIFDVCGELGNVVGGGFKGSLEELGHKSKLTIPM